jgi:pSer/pThr/pTyr-binding forkhead associated (FHA) protein
LSLEVISGPSSRLRMSIKSDTSPAELTIGRLPPSSLILDDPEVSGKHAFVKFNDEVSSVLFLLVLYKKEVKRLYGREANNFKQI